MRDGRPLSKPKGCPDWMYIIMHQCWTHDSVQRPSVLAIFDCLTSRYFRNFVVNIKTEYVLETDKSNSKQITQILCHVSGTQLPPGFNATVSYTYHNGISKATSSRSK